MKVRTGFVSNSSSSNFICDACGHDHSGWDATLEDAGMYSCIKGHTFCECHLTESTEEQISDAWNNYWTKIVNNNKEELDKNKENKYLEKLVKSSEEQLLSIEKWKNTPEKERDYGFKETFLSVECEGSRYDILPVSCPICSRQILKKEEGLEFLKKKFSLSDKDILEMIKEEDKKGK